MGRLREWLDARHNQRMIREYRMICATPPVINGRLHVGLFADTWQGRIVFGKNVVINSSFASNPVGGVQTAFVLKGAEAVLELQDGVGISNAMFGVRERITVGAHTNIGAGAKIFDTDFHSLDYEERMADVNIPSAPVTIGAGVFIGGGAIILKGVTIGERAVIGAGAVVARDVPADEVWAGNPAKCVKQLKPPA